MQKLTWGLLTTLVFLFGNARNSNAAMLVHDTYVGNVGLSTDGLGTLSGSGLLQTTLIPHGSSILAAYIYAQAPSLGNWSSSPVITFNGTTIGGATLVDGGNTARFDVTALVQAGYNPNATEQNWTMFENTSLEGSTLAVVYANSSLSPGAVVLANGGLKDGNHTFSTSLPAAIGPTGDVKMAVGIDFSFPGVSQRTEITVNGTRLTSSAGGFDDGQSSNGALLTTGGFTDSLLNPVNPFDTAGPDDELYNLRPFVNAGDTSINFNMAITGQDRVYFMGLQYQTAPPVAVPEPSTFAMLGMASASFAGYFGWRRRKQVVAECG